MARAKEDVHRLLQRTSGDVLGLPNLEYACRNHRKHECHGLDHGLLPNGILYCGIYGLWYVFHYVLMV